MIIVISSQLKQMETLAVVAAAAAAAMVRSEQAQGKAKQNAQAAGRKTVLTI